jgi:hypothetical protein
MPLAETVESTPERCKSVPSTVLAETVGAVTPAVGLSNVVPIATLSPAFLGEMVVPLRFHWPENCPKQTADRIKSSSIFLMVAP